MEIQFDPLPEDEQSGLICFVSWDSLFESRNFEKLIKLKVSERILGADITPSGIRILLDVLQ